MRAAWLIFLVAGVAAAAEPLVSLGHIPIAVRDLDAASADYRALGFTLKPGHLHDDSILNNHVKFAAGTELELITASEPRDELAAKYLRLISAGEGPAFLALEWTDAKRVRAALTQAHIGFEQGAYFTLSDPSLDYLFFGGNDRSPTDLPEHYWHANTAVSLAGVWIADSENKVLRHLLLALGAAFSRRSLQLPGHVPVTDARLLEGTISLLPRSQRLIADRPIIGVVLRVTDISAAESLAVKAGIVGLRSVNAIAYRSLLLPPNGTHGLWLEFREM